MELDAATDARLELQRRWAAPGEARIVIGRFF
jgi:hypothetical protein